MTLSKNDQLMAAVRACDLARVAAVLADPDVDPAVDDNYTLCLAATYGHDAVVGALLADDRVDPTARNNLALFWAVRDGHVDVAARLFADPRITIAEKKGSYGIYGYLFAAVNSRNIDMVKFILEDRRIDPMHGGNVALWHSVTLGFKAATQLLLADPRVDPSVCDGTLESTIDIWFENQSDDDDDSLVYQIIEDQRVIDVVDTDKLGIWFGFRHDYLLGQLFATSRRRGTPPEIGACEFIWMN